MKKIFLLIKGVNKLKDIICDEKYMVKSKKIYWIHVIGVFKNPELNDNAISLLSKMPICG